MPSNSDNDNLMKEANSKKKTINSEVMKIIVRDHSEAPEIPPMLFDKFEDLSG